jgi:hypothetical protein
MTVSSVYTLPSGSLNFQNGKMLVPMTLEDLAHAFMAKLACGGWIPSHNVKPYQMQILDLPNVHLAHFHSEHRKLAEADAVDPVLKKFGGGANIEVRVISTPSDRSWSPHLCAMQWANAVNTAWNGRSH